MSSMKYPYRDLGVPFDRNFRNDLNANFDDIEHDIKMVGGEAAQQALEAAEEANTQAIYAQTSGDYANDKGDYAAQQGDYAQTQGNYAKAQGDYAKAQGDYAKQVADENKTRWLTAVNTYADIAATYPNPQLGDTVQTIDDSKIYRWDGTQWVWTQQYNSTALNNLANELSKQNKQTATISHGLNIINASQNSPLDIRIEGRTLVNMSQNVLDPTKYYVLADKKSKVKFSDGTTYSGVAKFQGKAEKPILIRVENFEGKVIGSTLENPHISKLTNSSKTLQNPSSGSFVEINASGTAYSKISSLNGDLYVGVSAVTSGVFVQQLFSFNLIEAVERTLGKIPASDTAGKVTWLKNNIAKLTCNWWGYGQSPSGYKASLSRWDAVGNTWIFISNHTNSSVTKLYGTPNLNNCIDSNGYFHMLAYADPSDGVTPSTIYTDYVELEIELKPDAQLWNPRFPLYEVDATEYANILTTWDENEVMRRYPMVESVQHVQNPYIIVEGENLLPPFTEWNLHANARVKSAYELELNATGEWQATQIIINASSNTPYTLLIEGTGGGRVYYRELDANSNTINAPKSIAVRIPISFTTSPNTRKLQIIVDNGNTTSGTFTFTNPMLTLGSTAKPFVPRNPSYLFAEVKLGSLGDKKDILWKDGQDWKVTKWIEKDVVLDGKLSWSFMGDYTGYKRFNYAGLSNTLPNINENFVLTKFDGKKLKFRTDSNWQTDEAYCFNNTVSISVSDTDTGWGEHYKPSAQEIQAYFNGWKANGYTIGTAITNELTGQLAPSGTYTFAQSGAYRNVVVEKSTDGSTWSPATENTDFSININGSKAVLTNLSASPLYFRISYNYGVSVNSWASLVDGSAPATNTLEYVSTNLAPNFTPYKLSYVLATPKTEVVTDKVEGDLVVNGATQVEVGSGFTYTEVDGKRTYTKLAGNQRYNVTSNILSIIANYDSSLKSVVDSVVAKQSDIAAQVSVNVRAIAELYKRVKALGG